MLDSPTTLNVGKKVRVGVREFRDKLTAYLREVRNGTSLMITSHDTIIAEIHPPSPLATQRQPGALRGKIWMSEDFDEMPADLLAAMEE